MNIKLPDEWKELLAEEFEKPYFRTLTDFVRAEYTAAAQGRGPRIYPAPRNIFRALDKCLPADVKVVIIGQDPYHGPRQANGLCFSVDDGVTFPPSLRNIFKEIASDIGAQRLPRALDKHDEDCFTDGPLARPSGNLDRWAEQGVLLLNASLTVREAEANSHSERGWQLFTDAIVDALSASRQGVVYMLWGAFAQRKGERVPPERNLVLKAAHPSPLSAHNGFFGCRHFSKANEYLVRNNMTPIVW